MSSENLSQETKSIQLQLVKIEKNKENSHSTISEKESSEESEDPSFLNIIGNFFDENNGQITNILEINTTEMLGEVDLEYAFVSQEENHELFNPYLRKTSFFYIPNQNRESVFEKYNSMKNSSFCIEKDNSNSKPTNNSQQRSANKNKGHRPSRRASQLAFSTKNSKNERIESLAKIQSDLMNRIFKQSEKSYNFIINGQKYQVNI